MIPVSGTVFVIIMIVGVIGWIYSSVDSVRNRAKKRAAAKQLAADLQPRGPQQDLPYGFVASSGEDGPES